ncbi:hypothetical protein BJ508DRAFT_64355 [Ascobolus immersus RN42]|uniref:Uncharacterized protein n=1 Tax=Ascobolus immersus RN42 TaxID=1160509 RepID=A0A3N4INQ6_ASCIM|nr:hypothetical protein BJ508DRAFT_64355 [Ascobolus immersus RN42]
MRPLFCPTASRWQPSALILLCLLQVAHASLPSITPRATNQFFISPNASSIIYSDIPYKISWRADMIQPNWISGGGRRGMLEFIGTDFGSLLLTEFFRAGDFSSLELKFSDQLFGEEAQSNLQKLPKNANFNSAMLKFSIIDLDDAVSLIEPSPDPQPRFIPKSIYEFQSEPFTFRIGDEKPMAIDGKASPFAETNPMKGSDATPNSESPPLQLPTSEKPDSTATLNDNVEGGKSNPQSGHRASPSTSTTSEISTEGQEWSEECCGDRFRAEL